ncbi:hypothetical protein [Jidongwangia harbinensis]|uniref:hypothetical protein n=1 Tax=Jidongwangia harbinensis TaxID=2878561 RepID=UPI001CDA1F69|nr:hypothetical protein [Jidongwangia harbinensis]MCA2218964.1 hypothetical protein [Jidongwangia harbinensis]
MTDHEDQLRRAFATHENEAPDPAAVYARVQDLARSYRWRRRGVQAAGGMVLGAGLIAGAITVPGMLPGNQDNSFNMVAPAAAPSAAPSVSPLGPGADPNQREYDAFFAAGYDYGDAEQLAKIWKSKEEIGQVKIEAGRRLLAGETLPVRPTPDDNDSGGEEVEVDPVEEARYRAYFEAGYVYEDAERLAELWNLDDPSKAKVEAGKKLLDGKKLPFKPKPANVADALEGKRVNKFFEAGYDVDDAVQLAKVWNLDTAYKAKVEGGKRLLAGNKLPIKP